MSQSEKIFVNNVGVRLDSVDYKFICDPKGNANLSIVATDSTNIDECDFEHIVIRLLRTVKFSPSDFYSIGVTVVLNYSLNEKTKENFETKKELLKYAKEHVNVLINKTPVCSSISAIISEVTSSFGQVPIITSAQIIEKKD